MTDKEKSSPSISKDDSIKSPDPDSPETVEIKSVENKSATDTVKLAKASKKNINDNRAISATRGTGDRAKKTVSITFSVRSILMTLVISALLATSVTFGLLWWTTKPPLSNAEQRDIKRVARDFILEYSKIRTEADVYKLIKSTQGDAKKLLETAVLEAVKKSPGSSADAPAQIPEVWSESIENAQKNSANVIITTDTTYNSATEKGRSLYILRVSVTRANGNWSVSKIETRTLTAYQELAPTPSLPNPVPTG